MSLIVQQRKKNLYGALAILLGVVLASLAWAQIVGAISNCFSSF